MNKNKKESFPISVKPLSKYIISEYNNFCKKRQIEGKISTIKLHKSLYFLFAFWGAKSKKINMEFEKHEMKHKNFVNKIDIKNENIFGKYNEFLFDSIFQAWTYGPVIPEIWFNKEIRKFNEINFKFESNLENKEDESFLKGFVDDVLKKVFNKSDFSLVERTHEDECWKKSYLKFLEEKKPVKIEKNEIINDYLKLMNN